MSGWKEEELRQLNRLGADLKTVNSTAPSPFTLLPMRQGALPLHASSPSTCTRAWASMLPAGVLLTQRYQVPSYTSTLLMRKVPFLETSNRESCSTQDTIMRGLSMNPHQHHPGGSLRKDHYGGQHRGEQWDPPPAVILTLTSEMSIWFLYQMIVGFGVAWVRQCK